MELTTYAVYTLYGIVLAIAYSIADSIITWIGDYRFAKAHGCKSPPKEPTAERILGVQTFLAILKAAREGTILDYATKRYQTGETYESFTMRKRVIHTIDPENIKAILATQFKDFGLGTRERDFGLLLGQGIFTTDGERWEHSRALVRPSFTRTQVADLDSFEQHIQTMFSLIPTDGQTVVDLSALLFRLTFDSSTEFLFGESVKSLTSPEGSVEQEFSKKFDRSQALLAKRLRLPRIIQRFFYTEIYDDCKFVHNFVDRFVHRALDYRRDVVSGRVSEKEQSERYVFLHEAAKATDDALQLRSEILNILLAGRDTTASLLANTLHVLVRRPDVWKKLLAEVDQLEGKLPTYEQIKEMKYMRNVLNESLRVYPVVPGNARFAYRRTTLPRGGGLDGTAPVFIRKGQMVSYLAWGLHRRKDYFGEDADEFRPERWDTLRTGWNYLPFNGGPRICVGQQYALMQASYFLIRFLQTFEYPENRDPEPWKENLALTVVTANGVQVVMKKRGE